MNESSIEYIVASYLMSKGRHAAFRVGPTLCPGGCLNETQCGDKLHNRWRGSMFDYPQLTAAAAVGAAAGSMEPLPGGVGWRRKFSKGIVLVNNGEPTVGRATTVQLQKKYKSLSGRKVSGNVSLPAGSARVLLSVGV